VVFIAFEVLQELLINLTDIVNLNDDIRDGISKFLGIYLGHGQ